jgi:hypothetical protein
VIRDQVMGDGVKRQLPRDGVRGRGGIAGMKGGLTRPRALTAGLIQPTRLPREAYGPQRGCQSRLGSNVRRVSSGYGTATYWRTRLSGFGGF